MEEATAMGISGTPAFLINGQQLFGAQPYELFAQVVESIVAETPTQPASN